MALLERLLRRALATEARAGAPPAQPAQPAPPAPGAVDAGRGVPGALDLAITRGTQQPLPPVSTALPLALDDEDGWGGAASDAERALPLPPAVLQAPESAPASTPTARTPVLAAFAAAAAGALAFGIVRLRKAPAATAAASAEPTSAAGTEATSNVVAPVQADSSLPAAAEATREAVSRSAERRLWVRRGDEQREALLPQADGAAAGGVLWRRGTRRQPGGASSSPPTAPLDDEHAWASDSSAPGLLSSAAELTDNVEGLRFGAPRGEPEPDE